MPSSRKPLLFSLLTLLINQTTSHFLLHSPPSLGFDSNNEGTAPCGGFSLSFSNTIDFHVQGDALSLTTLHPQSNFLFRAQLEGAPQNNWTNLLPVVQEFGLGAFCEGSVAVPAAWVGQNGVIQITQDAEDGVHYQCAAVRFIDGNATSLPSSCQNATGLTANFGSDTTLLPASSGPTPASSGSATSTVLPTSASAAPATTSSSAASAMKVMNVDSMTEARCFLWWIGIALVMQWAD